MAKGKVPGTVNKMAAVKGRASIYKGTDKSTDKAGKVTVKKTSTKPVVYGNSNYKPKPTPKSKVMGSR